MFGGNPPRPPEDVDTIAISYELVATSRTAAATAGELAKALMEIRTRLRNELGDASANVEMPPTDTLRRFLPHAGTVAFVDDEVKSWFETYSDAIWIGLFALSIVGSSVTGLWSWLHKHPEYRGPEEKLGLLADRLNKAETSEDLNDLISDLDQFIVDLCSEYRHGHITGSELSSLTALVQACTNVVGRRRYKSSTAPPFGDDV